MQNAFLSFIHAAFGDDHETLAQLQLIAGRLFLPQCNKVRQVYAHVGSNGDGRTTFLRALEELFKTCYLTANYKNASGYVGVTVQNRVPPDCPYTSKLYVWDQDELFDATAAALSLEEFKVRAFSTLSMKNNSRDEGMQTHVTCAGIPQGALGAEADRRTCQIHWHFPVPDNMRTPEFAKGLAQDPDFIIWLAEGLRRAQAIDKVQPTIDRPAADIVLSDEPSE